MQINNSVNISTIINYDYNSTPAPPCVILHNLYYATLHKARTEGVCRVFLGSEKK